MNLNDGGKYPVKDYQESEVQPNLRMKWEEKYLNPFIGVFLNLLLNSKG